MPPFFRSYNIRNRTFNINPKEALIEKSFGQNDPGIAAYVTAAFRPEDPALSEIRARANNAGLPEIHVSPYDSRILEVIARSCGAKKIVEIGTLAGYSTLSLFRGLASGGKVWTFEYEPKHAAVANETIQRNGMTDSVTLLPGAALDNLSKIESHGPFDLVFIDADKINYPNYLRWAGEHLRVGGTVLLDNTFAWGNLADMSKHDDEVRAFREVNAILAANDQFRGVIIPTGEGLSMGVKIR